MSSHISFKIALEQHCKFVFQPSSNQLTQIAIDIVSRKPQSSGDVFDIVKKTCPDVLAVLLEGLDNSDLRTLIALAMKIAVRKG